MKIRKKDVFFVFLLSLTLILNACSTLSDSLILGMGSGAIVGGAVSRQTHKDANSGMAIGAAVGGLSAYLIHKGIEKREEKIRRETLLNLEKFDVSAPKKTSSSSLSEDGGHYLTKPVVDMEWIETQVQGDKLVEGHRVWKIVEKPKWISSDNSNKEQKR